MNVKQTSISNLPDDERRPLAEEVAAWESGALSPQAFVPSPESAPRARETEAISIRMPSKQLVLLKEFARRNNIGYQILIKQWLDDRLRSELERVRIQKQLKQPFALTTDAKNLLLACTSCNVGLEAPGRIQVHRPAMHLLAAASTEANDISLTPC